MLSLVLLLACATSSSSPPLEDSGHGSVEVRVWGDAVDTARPDGCDGPGGAGGVEGAVVWTPVDGLRPQQRVLSWTDCGPQPAGLVMPTGSSLTLRNDSQDRLSIDWTAGELRGSAVLAPGAQRALSLPEEGVLEVRADGQLATVVLGGSGAVTDAHGRASLHQVPAGTRELHVLHPDRGARLARLSVPEGDRVHFEVELR